MQARSAAILPDTADERERERFKATRFGRRVGASKLNDKARHWLGEYRSSAESHVMPCATDARRGAVGSSGAAVGALLVEWSGVSAISARNATAYRIHF